MQFQHKKIIKAMFVMVDLERKQSKWCT